MLSLNLSSSLAERLQVERPRPIASVTLTVIKDEGRNGDSDSYDALESALIKRECVGAFINSKQSLVNIHYPRNIELQSSDIYAPSRSIVKHVSEMFVIMPNTRITLIMMKEDETGTSDNIDEQIEVSESNQSPNNNHNHKNNNSSKCTSTIIDTIMSIHRIISLSKKRGGDFNSLDIPRTMMMTGPPGVGKTYAVKQVLEYFNASYHNISLELQYVRGSDLLSHGYADAEKRLRTIFASTAKTCHNVKNKTHIGLIFIDEGEALTDSIRVSSQLGILLDELSTARTKLKGSEGWEKLLVIMATNRVGSIPVTLRRPGRIDREVIVSPPKVDERVKILKTLLNKSTTLPSTLSDEDLEAVAELCVGFVGADLVALVRLANMKYFEKAMENSPIIANQSSTFRDLLIDSIQEVGAACLRDTALSAPPTTTWSDIGGDVGGAKTALRRAIEWPRLRKKAFEAFDLSPPKGILLYGPPGCAKTTLARAAAGATSVSFITLSPAEVFNSSYVGEAEAVIRRAFEVARSASPCILFFDEIDAILGGSKSDSRGHGAESRILSTFLNEMDGVESTGNDGVMVLGATNRPFVLDSALLRPGRFDKVIYVPEPDEEGRRSILQLHCGKWAKNKVYVNGNDKLIDIDELSHTEYTKDMTGAELGAACQEAAMSALREGLDCVFHRHLVDSLQNVTPLLRQVQGKEMLEEYAKFQSKNLQ